MNQLSRFAFARGAIVVAILLVAIVIGIGVAPSVAQIGEGSVGSGTGVGGGGGIDPEGAGIGPSRGIDPSDNVGARRRLDPDGATGGIHAGMTMPLSAPRWSQDNSDQLTVPGVATDTSSSIGGDLGARGGLGDGPNGR